MWNVYIESANFIQLIIHINYDAPYMEKDGPGLMNLLMMLQTYWQIVCVWGGGGHNIKSGIYNLLVYSLWTFYLISSTFYAS